MATSLYKFQEALKTCEEHPNEELSCFCKTCKEFICTTCAKTTHHGHEWDLIPIVAKKQRKETPVLCQKIRQEKMPRCREKLRIVQTNISDVEKATDGDVKKLEERRTAMIDAVNQIIDEQKINRIAIKKKECAKLEEDCSRLRTKIEYVDKMTTSLDSNIDAYTDFDMIKMEIEMLKSLTELEMYDVDVRDTEVTYVPGEINRATIEEMIGRIKDTPRINVTDSVCVMEMKTFDGFNRKIRAIAQTSSHQAWIRESKNYAIKQVSLQSTETKSVTLPPHVDFITLSNGDFIVTNSNDQVIRRFTSTGKPSDMVSTMPLHPSWISKTQTGDILVSLKDSGYLFNLTPSSRRLVQRMTLTGKILRRYEFHKNGTTRLFTQPLRTAENGNSDVCVVNCTSDDTGELIVLYGDGRVRATYRGQEDSKCAFDPSDVACDSRRRIIVSDWNNKRLHLLSSDGIFLKYLLSDMFDYPHTIALYQDNLWVGFAKGTVTVYKYSK